MPVVGRTKYTDDGAIIPELTDDQKHELDQKMKLADKALKEQGKAKYKVELMFVRARSTWKPTWGAISIWESGAKLHGGGDGAMYFCPGKKLGKNDCEMPIPSYSNAMGHMVCPHCGSVWDSKAPHNVHIGNYTMRTWAELLYKYYRVLGHDADLYLKHSPDDIRSIAAMEQERQLGGDLLTRMRNSRALHIYPLANIIKDTAAGADILSRFYAFLTA